MQKELFNVHKTCYYCGQTIDTSIDKRKWQGRRCGECVKRKSQKWEKERYGSPRYAHFARKYNLTEEEWFSLLEEQDYRCAICDKELPDDISKIATDHIHGTKIVRGLLCISCNGGMHFLDREDNWLEKALDYQKRGKEKL